MENNQLQRLDKKSFIKKELKKIIGLVAFVLIGVYIQHGYIPIKPVIVVLGTMIPLILISSFLFFKYPDVFKYLRYSYSGQVLDHEERNRLKEMSKKKIIKIILANIGISLLFLWFLFFALYIFFGTSIPTQVLLIVSGFLIIYITTVIYLYYKHSQKN